MPPRRGILRSGDDDVEQRLLQRGQPPPGPSEAGTDLVDPRKRGSWASDRRFISSSSTTRIFMAPGDPPFPAPPPAGSGRWILCRAALSHFDRTPISDRKHPAEAESEARCRPVWALVVEEGLEDLLDPILRDAELPVSTTSICHAPVRADVGPFGRARARSAFPRPASHRGRWCRG